MNWEKRHGKGKTIYVDKMSLTQRSYKPLLHFEPHAAKLDLSISSTERGVEIVREREREMAHSCH